MGNSSVVGSNMRLQEQDKVDSTEYDIHGNQVFGALLIGVSAW